MDRIYLDLERYGNTSAASVPIALAEAVDEGRVRPGDRILFVAFGAGFTSGAAAITWTADPAQRPKGGERAAGGEHPSAPGLGRRRPGAGTGRADPGTQAADGGAGVSAATSRRPHPEVLA